MDSRAEKLKNEFCELLRSTKRDGVEYIIEDLEDMGFFEAPASMKHHCNYEGGLVDHSLKVYKAAMKLKEDIIELNAQMAKAFNDDSIIICTLLHDVCKADIYKKMKRKRKTAIGIWEEYEVYDVDYSSFPMGHGEKSVIRLLQSGLELDEEEMLAIRWHMGAWDLAFQSPEMKGNINIARDKYPLVSLVTHADGIASAFLEYSDNYIETNAL